MDVLTALWERATRWLLAAVLAGVWGLAAACAESGDSARFEVDTPQQLEECLDEAFPLEPSFFAARDHLETVSILMQTKTRIGPEGDLVYLEIFNPAEMAGRLGEPITFNYPTDTDSPVRGEVALYESCPQSNASLAIEGTVIFEEFGAEAGDRIVGEFSGATIIDARAEEPVAGISGSWDFSVEIAVPHRIYPDGRSREDFPTDL